MAILSLPATLAASAAVGALQEGSGLHAYLYDDGGTSVVESAPARAFEPAHLEVHAGVTLAGTLRSSYDDRSNLARPSARPSGEGLAPNTARALPQELAVGRNAQSGVHVYHGVDAGKPVYAGITDDIARRQAQHGGRFVLDQLTPAAGVTRGQARAIEER
jgi:hypothetical protein